MAGQTMNLHVLTAVTRPDNLTTIATSLAVAADAADVRVIWHWRYDIDREHVGGQQCKNDMLDDVPDGWVWVLDDDTIAHPEIFMYVTELARANPEACAIVFSQRRADGNVLTASPDARVPGQIDIGQVVMSRALIGDERIPIAYDGDGWFLSTVLRKNALVLYRDEVLTFHNALEHASAPIGGGN